MTTLNHGLRKRFNRDFWMEAKGCYALALQKDGRPAAVVSSNPGQALWTGIADEEKAHRTIDRLMAPDMFSGWGVRTLSEKERAYNPISYHLGTVWPHDNSILASGFRRYGRDEEALRIFQGLFDAAFHFHARTGVDILLLSGCTPEVSEAKSIHVNVSQTLYLAIHIKWRSPGIRITRINLLP